MQTEDRGNEYMKYETWQNVMLSPGNPAPLL